jgi:hypothetical protein
LEASNSRKLTRSVAAPTSTKPEAISDASSLPRETEPPLVPSPNADRRLTVERDAVQRIETAHEHLHRVEAMLTFVGRAEQTLPKVIEYLDEARHSCVQALECCRIRDFEAARELAAASGDFAVAVEIIISKEFDDLAGSQNFATAAEGILGRALEAPRAKLKQVQDLLGKLRWVTQNGTIPSEECRRITKICLWTDALCSRAERLFEVGAEHPAIESTLAAQAAACAAQHLCRSHYVTRVVPAAHSHE